MKIKGFAEYNKRADYGCQMEILVSLIYHALVRQNEVVIEGGANGGLHAVPLARLISPSGRLICFEPLPTVHAQLKQYIASERLLNVTELHCSALGESEGKIEFVEVHDNCALSHIKSDVEDTKERTDVIEVILETIDTTFLLQQLNFIKLDLEGYDFIALKGGERTLRKFRPPIIFENGREWHAKKYHYTKEDLFQFFDDIEYEVFDIHNTFLNRDNWESPDLGFEFFAVYHEDKRKETIRNLISQFWEHADERPIITNWLDCMRAVKSPKDYLTNPHRYLSR